MSTGKREQFVEEVLHFALACPHNGDNPPFCPLHEIRKLSPEERIEWIHMLTDEDLAYIAAYHQICLQWMGNAV